MGMCKWFFKDATKFQNGCQRSTLKFFVSAKTTKLKKKIIQILLSDFPQYGDVQVIFLGFYWNSKWPPWINFIFSCGLTTLNKPKSRQVYTNDGIITQNIFNAAVSTSGKLKTNTKKLYFCEYLISTWCLLHPGYQIWLFRANLTGIQWVKRMYVWSVKVGMNLSVIWTIVIFCTLGGLAQNLSG